MAYSISDYDTQYSIRLENARLASHAVDAAILDSHTREEVVGLIVEAHAAPMVVLHPSTIFAEPREQATIAGASAPLEPLPLELRLTMSCTGAVQALTEASAPVSQATLGKHSTVSYSLTLTGSTISGSELTTVKNSWIVAMTDAASTANATISEHRAEMQTAVDAIVGPRHALRASLVRAASEAMISLTPVTDHPVPIPLTPQRLTLDNVNKAAEGQNSEIEAALAESIADDLVGLISAFSHSLERTPTTAGKLLKQDEETIRDVLLFILNANWKGTATGETFVGIGKTDILLRWKDRDAFIGECKIWKGEAAFESGLTQLLKRYTVWRATRVAMILFVRDIKDVTGVIEKATTVITTHDRFIDTIPQTDPAAFRLRAQHDARQIVTLHLVPVVIPNA